MEDLQWKPRLSMFVQETFQTMFAMKLKQVEASSCENLEGNRIVGSVGFAGAVMGMFYIDLPTELAQTLTTIMLGTECDTKDGSLVKDVIGELSNIIGGQLKSYLSDYGLPCVLSIPSITRGSDFHIDPMSGTKRERFVFHRQGSDVSVIIYVDVKSE